MTIDAPKRKTAADFIVGQLVYCPYPGAFISSFANYLDGRQGIVVEIAPVTRPNPQYGGHINRVLVEWQKRGNRGKTRRVQMYPRDIEALVIGEAMP
jgi:hypothetical protein